MLLDTVAFAGAMEALRRSAYDHVVVDTPAVLGSAEVNIVSDSVDGVLLTTWSGRSRARELRETIAQLTARKILGVIHIEG
jgi:Mrp family chromosome partitioning ATPase